MQAHRPVAQSPEPSAYLSFIFSSEPPYYVIYIPLDFPYVQSYVILVTPAFLLPFADMWGIQLLLR
jgi:hypothetical protein